MAWGYVQGNKTAATATALSSVACTYVTANVSAGTSLLAHVTTSTQTGTTDTVATVKDGAGNNFLRIMHIAGGSPNILNDVSVWILNTPVGDVGTKPTITATLSGGTANMGILIEEWSGLAAGATLALLVDGTGGVLTGATTGATGSPTYSSSVANELLLKIYGDSGGPITYTAPSGTADANNVNSNSPADLAVVYGNSTGGAEAGSWSLAGTATQWGVILVALKLASTTITGTGGLQLPPLAEAGSGTATPPAITGTGSLLLAALAMAGSSTARTLILSMAPASGTDPVTGKGYPEGLSVGAPGSQQVQLLLAGLTAFLNYPSGASIEGAAANIAAHVIGGGAAEFLQILLSGPKLNVAGHLDWVQLQLNSSNDGGTTDAQCVLLYIDTGGTVHEYAMFDGTGFNILAGSITAAHPGSSPAVPETWQSLGTFGSATWTINQGRYRINGDGELEIDIALNAQVGGGAAGTFTWTTTLPAGYQPAGNFARAYDLAYNGTITAGQNYGCVLVDGAGTATAGRVRMQLAALPATTNVGGTIRIPLT